MSQNSKTAKMVLGRYYRVLNSRLALTRLAILNTWNKNTKTEITNRNKNTSPCWHHVYCSECQCPW